MIDVNIASYADVETPYIVNKTEQLVFKEQEKLYISIFECLDCTYININQGSRHLELP